MEDAEGKGQKGGGQRRDEEVGRGKGTRTKGDRKEEGLGGKEQRGGGGGGKRGEKSKEIG